MANFNEKLVSQRLKMNGIAEKKSCIKGECKWSILEIRSRPRVYRIYTVYKPCAVIYTVTPCPKYRKFK